MSFWRCKEPEFDEMDRLIRHNPGSARRNWPVRWA